MGLGSVAAVSVLAVSVGDICIFTDAGVTDGSITSVTADDGVNVSGRVGSPLEHPGRMNKPVKTSSRILNFIP